MTTSPHLFGQALADHFHSRPKGPFLVCDELGEHPVDLGFYFTEKPTALETEALDHAHGRILDVGCGPGRVLKFFQTRGYDATGFDIDPIVVQLCKERGIVNAVVESYHNLDRFAPADTVLWLNRTICTGGTIPQIRTLLESSREATSREGVLILESVEVRPDLANRGQGVLENTLHFRYGGQIGPPFTRTYFSSFIAEHLLRETGWRHIQTMRRDDTYIAVARNEDGLRTSA